MKWHLKASHQGKCVAVQHLWPQVKPRGLAHLFKMLPCFGEFACSRTFKAMFFQKTRAVNSSAADQQHKLVPVMPQTQVSCTFQSQC